MESQLRLIVHWKKSVYDDLLVTSTSVDRNETKRNDEETRATDEEPKRERRATLVPHFLNKREIDSYAVSAYVCQSKNSQSYRRCAAAALARYASARAPKGRESVVFVRLREPTKPFLDYRWGERAARMALEKCEVDHAMSWLSTLGGAFSALGERFRHCAQMAGKISIHQFTLALRLGDPLLVARCKLYAALSITQQGNYRLPKIMILDIHKFAVEQKDTHLQRMCRGVWAKLKYCCELRKQEKKKRKEIGPVIQRL